MKLSWTESTGMLERLKTTLNAGADAGIHVLQSQADAAAPEPLEVRKVVTYGVHQCACSPVGLVDVPLCEFARDGAERLELGAGIEHDIERQLDVRAVDSFDAVGVEVVLVEWQIDPSSCAEQSEVAGTVIAFDDGRTVDEKVSAHVFGQSLPEGTIPAPATSSIAVEDTMVCAPPRIEPPAIDADKAVRFVVHAGVVNTDVEAS